MSAARRSSRTTRHRAAIGWSDKIVADVDAVFLGVGDLAYGPRVVALCVAQRHICYERRVVAASKPSATATILEKMDSSRARSDFGYPVRSVFMWCSYATIIPR